MICQSSVAENKSRDRMFSHDRCALSTLSHLLRLALLHARVFLFALASCRFRLFLLVLLVCCREGFRFFYWWWWPNLASVCSRFSFCFFFSSPVC